MQNPKIVTTSWDDGDPLDLKVAGLLRARHLPGTFYFPFVGYDGGQTLAPAQLRSLASEGFEVGGHTMSHRVLPQLSSREIAREVGICKNRLEDTLGERIRMFCYPKGRFNAAVLRHVKDAGYEGARTTSMFSQGLDFSPFRMPTSLHAYPNTRMQYTKNLVKGQNIRGLLNYVTQLIRLDSWVSIGKILFDRVLKEGGIWHLYGHSWLIEETGLWDDLKEILDYVCGREGVRYLTNAEVLTLLPEKIPAPPPNSILQR
jgi:peptidoglycan/xylan/chitin deacetylase (PgdA/CDA1 family)